MEFKDYCSIRIPCAAGENWVFPAYRFEVDSHSEHEFVVHKSVQPDAFWCVAELSTGFAVITSRDAIEDMAEAAQMAIARLALKSKEEVNAAIEKARVCLVDRERSVRGSASHEG